MKGKKANESSNRTFFNSDSETQRAKLANRLSREDLSWLRNLFEHKKSITSSLDDLYNFFINKKLLFLNSISNKLQIEDFQEFLTELTYTTR